MTATRSTPSRCAPSGVGQPMPSVVSMRNWCASTNHGCSPFAAEARRANAARMRRHGLDLAPLKGGDRAKALDLGLLHVELLLHVVGEDLQTLLLDGKPRGHFLRLVTRSARLSGGDEVLSHQIRVGLRLPLRLAIGGLGGGEGSCLSETLGFEIGLEGDQFGFGGGELTLRLEALDLDIRVAQLEQKGVFVHDHSGLHQHPVHSPRGHRRNPSDLFRNQSARTPDLPDHRSLPHGVHPQGPQFDRGCGRFEPTEPHGRGHDRNDGGR